MKNLYQKKLLRRLKIIEGQIRGLQKMVKEDTYCIDIITQTSAVKKALHIPIYSPKKDIFMLSSDPLGQGTPKSTADYEVTGDETLTIEGIELKFRHFPGHTPGCSIIEINDVWFSGDFLFAQSIGRWDFPSSSGEEMAKSIEKALKIKEDYTVYPGHGLSTTLKAEQKVLPFWLEQVKKSF